MNKSIQDLAREACLELGVEYITVPTDGEFHATKLIDGHKRGQARIKLFSDGAGGLVFNWVTGLSLSFFINQSNGVTVTQQDRDKAEAEQKRRKVELINKQNKAARKAHSLFTRSTLAPPEHPYLIKKRIKPHLTRQADWEKWVLDKDGQWTKILIKDALLIPLFNADGVIRNIQAIFPVVPPELERNKDFLPKAELSGLFSWMGEKTETVAISEGFATGATIHEETGYRVYIAFTANNLLAVAQTIRKRLPKAKIILCGDNDEKTKGNPGLTKATEAASIIDGLVAIPPIAGDFNDYAIYLQDAAHDE